MKKRSYRLGKRQASVDETRRRILHAAEAEYEKNGIDETTMIAVARRADVASGTVLYHYPKPEMLAEAVVDMWIEQADLPEVPDVAEDLSLEARAELFLSTILDMYAAGRPTQGNIFRANPGHIAMEKARRFWDQRIEEVMEATLGPRLDSEDLAVISALIGAHFLGSLRQHGIEEGSLHSTVNRLMIGWLTADATRQVPTEREEATNATE